MRQLFQVLRSLKITDGKSEKKRIRAAQKEGKYQGRKTIIDKTLIQKVEYLKEEKNLSVINISKVTGVSTSTIYKVLKKYLNYVSNQLLKPEETNKGN